MKKLSMDSILRTGIVCVLAILYFIAFHCLKFLLDQPAPLTTFSYNYVIISFVLACMISLFMEKKPVIFLVSLGIVSFAVILTISLWAKTEPVSDFDHLYNLSCMLKNGGYEALRQDEYFIRWAYQSLFVIYQALVLSIFPNGITSLLVMNALFMTGTIIIIFLISREIFSVKTAIFISTLYFFYPAPYFLASVLTNQHISLFLILTGIYVLARADSAKGAVLCGSLVALGNAFRPDAAITVVSLCSIALITCIHSRKSGYKKLLQLTAPILTAIATIFLAGFLISTLVIISGINPNGQKNMDPLWKFVIGLNIESNGCYSSQLETKVFSVDDIEERHAVELEIIKDHLSIDANTIISFFRMKNMAFWEAYEETNWAFKNHDERIVPIIKTPLSRVLLTFQQAERLYFFVITALSCFSMVLIFREKEAHLLQVLCGLTVLFYFVVYTLIEVQSRYRYFILPFIFILAGASLDCLLNMKQRQTQAFTDTDVVRHKFSADD